MQNNIPVAPDNENNSFNIREQIDRYLIHWKWFTVSIIICLFVAFLYLRYATSEYNITATILIKDEKKGGLADELSAFSEIGFMSGAKSNVDNEIEVLKARTLSTNTIKELGFNVRYFNKGNVKTSEAYTKSPIKVNFFGSDKNLTEIDTTFSFKSISNTKFELFNADDEKLGSYTFGTPIKSALGNMVVTINVDSLYAKKADSEYNVIVQISPLDKVAQSYKNKLQVSTVNKMTSVISLSITDPVKEKGVDFLNTLIRRYNEDAINDKNEVARNTEIFINDRLSSLTKELDTVERNIETFKKEEGLTDIVSDVQLSLTTASEYGKNVIDNETQLKVVDYMLDFLNETNNDSVIPANLIPDGEAIGLIDEYNKLILTKERFLENATLQHPQIIDYDIMLEGLRNSILKSLNNLKSSLKIAKRNLESEENFLEGRINQAPRQEREYRKIERQKVIKEELYLYLLKKREENAISLAVTAPNAKIIDSAYANPLPVSPKSNIVLLAALILGFLIPFGIIYLRDLLDTKVHSNADLENLTVPFLGDVPRSETSSELVNLHGRSGTAEALRIIRTNLEFMLNQVPEGVAKTIFVTSTIPKEGKTFISVNLATTIAMTGKKVLLIGMDIRNPKLDEYINIPSKGLTNYLSSSGTNINEYIIKYGEFENFYILPPGIIPPNPAELLMGKKVKDLFEQLQKEYDYIIVDTAPVSLVTDTLIIAHFAHSFIYVSRANYLDKRMLYIAGRP